jgi:hypothetical protein
MLVRLPGDRWALRQGARVWVPRLASVHAMSPAWALPTLRALLADATDLGDWRPYPGEDKKTGDTK